MASFRARVVLSALAIGAAACGPGLESLHQSTLMFEHCYRLDTDPKIAPSHREHCWRDWTQTYAYGQSLDRIEYARRRIVVLESGDSRVQPIGRESAAEQRVFEEIGTSPTAPMAAPAPTSAHEPPPRTAPAPALPSASTPSSGRPGDPCSAQCGAAFGDCSKLCDAKQADCATCQEDYRRCMRRCFE